MKFTSQRDVLLSTIGTVSRAVSNRSTLPILAHILMEATPDAVWLSATDHEIGIRSSAPVQTAVIGRTTLPARLLNEVVGAQPAGQPLVFETDETDHATLTCGVSEMQVPGLPAEEFPIIPSLVGDTQLTLPQGLLKSMINATVIAVGHDETRARLTGVLFTLENGRLRLVATDTHRLATISAALEVGADLAISPIIPARALRELERLLDDTDDQTVQIDLTESQVQFTLPNVVLLSRLIDGEFPNYHRVIPGQTARTLTYRTAELRECVRRCAIVSRDDNNHKLVLQIAESGAVNLYAASSRGGRSLQKIEPTDVQITDGGSDDLEVAFNADYLLDVLGYIRADECRLGLTSASQPGVIRPVDATDYIYVLMPMQNN